MHAPLPPAGLTSFEPGYIINVTDSPLTPLQLYSLQFKIRLSLPVLINLLAQRRRPKVKEGFVIYVSGSPLEHALEVTLL